MARTSASRIAAGGWLAALAILFAVTFAASGVGTLLTDTDSAWYRELRQPGWAPPDWLFAPVWTLLYATMALAAWLVWRADGRSAAPALVLYGVQLALNVAWSGVFFTLREPGWAFAEILLLWAAVAATAVAFARHATAAGWLLVPYLAWVTFAAALNLAIWRLNA